MFKKLIPLSFFVLAFTTQTALASLTVSVEDVPSSINADIYTITVNTAEGAKVTVTGGTSQIPPVTDTDEDGIVEVMVGLIQESDNTFSILAEKDGDMSETLQIVITETASSGGGGGGDTTAPEKPDLDDYPSEIDAETVTLTGKTEASAIVTASKTDGTKLTSVTAKNDGTFSIKITLEQNKRNRINISAEDAAGNISLANQAVIVELNEDVPTDEEEVIVEDDKEEVVVKDDKEEVVVEDEDNETFTDTQNHWAKEYIRTLRIAGIVNGKSPGIFAPDAYLTRAELTKIALVAFDITVQDSLEKKFTDVSLNDWFVNYVRTARNEGIVNGYGNNFRPNQNVTRAEALKILLTTAQFDIPDASTDFTDVPNGAWYENYVAFAADNGIVGGYTDGTFRPNQPITRAEIAKIAVKAMELYSSLFTVDEETEDTTKDSDLVNGNRVYENKNFDFSLEYYKNWYYEGATGSGDTIIKIGFATVEDAIDNAEATLELKNDSLNDLGKSNLETETKGDEIRYFVEYSDSRHIEIYGDSSIQEKLETMAETLEVE